MLRVNRLTDYAVVLLAGVARGGGVLSARRVAADTGVPVPTASRLMKKLANRGLMVPARGAAGGYVLGRAPDSITVADMIQAVEGPIALTLCVENGGGGCAIETLCPICGGWSQVNSAVRKALSATTLADMAFGVSGGAKNGSPSRHEAESASMAKREER